MPRDYPYSIHVIESPSDLDLLERRQEREALHRALAQVGIGIEEHLVVSKRCLSREAVAVMNAAAGLPAGSFQAVDGAGLRRELAVTSRQKRLDGVRALLDPRPPPKSTRRTPRPPR